MDEEIPCLNVRVRIRKKAVLALMNVKGIYNPLVWTVDLTRTSNHKHPETRLLQEQRKARKERHEKVGTTVAQAVPYLPFALLALSNRRGLKV